MPLAGIDPARKKRRARLVGTAALVEGSDAGASSAPAARFGAIPGQEEVRPGFGRLGRTAHVQNLGQARRDAVHARILGRSAARCLGAAEREGAELYGPEAR